MTKQQITDIFNLFKALKEQDSKMQESFTAFCETISSDYAPFLNGNIRGLIELLKIVNNELREELERYFYDMPKDKKCQYIETEGKKYVVDTDAKFLKYLTR